MNTDSTLMNTDGSLINTDGSRILLDSDLSFKIRKVFIEVSRKYGPLHKEKVYHNACKEIFEREGLSAVSQPRISIISLDTGKRLGEYIPDFLVEDRIVIELKALEFLPKTAFIQLEQYLKVSDKELGFLVNFGTAKAQIFRRIYTNDRKPWLLSVSHP